MQLTRVEQSLRSAPAGGDASCRLFVGNLSYMVTEYQLLKVFKRFGTVVALHFPHDKSSGKQMGFAFVEYETRAMAEGCKTGLKGKSMLKRVVKCEWAVDQSQRDRDGGATGFGGGSSSSAGASADGGVTKRKRSPLDEIAAIEAKLLEMDEEDAAERKYALTIDQDGAAARTLGR
jgi:RNA recognition motif-containing protein